MSDIIPSTATANITAIGITDEKLTPRPAGAAPQKLLLVGMRASDADGVGTKNPVQIFSGEQASELAGARSEIAVMARAAIANINAIDVYILAIAEPAGATSATAMITVASASAGAGSVAFYISDQRIVAEYPANSTVAQIATVIAAAINANTIVSATAAANAAVITLTATYKGIAGNRIPISVNAKVTDPAPPKNLTINIENFSGAVGNIRFPDELPAEVSYTVIAHNISDAANFDRLEGILNARWEGDVKQPILAIGAEAGTVPEVTAITAARNSRFSAIVGTQNVAEGTAAVAAAVAGRLATQMATDPALQLHTTPITGITPPENQWTYTMRNSALGQGISTIKVVAGRVVIGQLKSTLTLTDQGAVAPEVDRSIVTMATIAAIIADADTYLTSNFSKSKLANDGRSLPANQRIVTPKLMRAEIINRYASWIALGWVEAPNQFAATLRVARSTQNPNRLDIELPIFVIGQLRITAVRISYNYAQVA